MTTPEEKNNQSSYFPAPRHTGSRITRARPTLWRSIVRTVLFTRFILSEYVRSGRIWIEFGALGAFYAIFLRGDVDDAKFFSLASLFTIILAIYTTSSVIGVCDRPPGYLVLARRVGRANYLLGIYLAAVLIVTVAYTLVSALTLVLSNLTGLDLHEWVLGSLPLLLNASLLAALLLLLSPLVFSTGWRLFVLGLIALAFSGSFLGNATIESLGPTLRTFIEGVQTILSWPLVPAFSGFDLALNRDYSGSAPVILLAQFSLLVVLLGLAVSTFTRRELILSPE